MSELLHLMFSKSTCIYVGMNRLVKFKIGVVADQDKDSKVNEIQTDYYYYYYYYYIRRKRKVTHGSHY